jgi:hypothetical protein
MGWQRLRSLRVNDNPQSFQLNTQGASRSYETKRDLKRYGSRSDSESEAIS